MLDVWGPSQVVYVQVYPSVLVIGAGHQTPIEHKSYSTMLITVCVCVCEFVCVCELFIIIGSIACGGIGLPWLLKLSVGYGDRQQQGCTMCVCVCVSLQVSMC